MSNNIKVVIRPLVSQPPIKVMATVPGVTTLEIEKATGDLSTLTTTEKTNLVGALNEVDADLAQHKLDYVEQLAEDLQDIHTFRVLPNGVKDEVINGEFTKRVYKKILSGDSIVIDAVLKVDLLTATAIVFTIDSIGLPYGINTAISDTTTPYFSTDFVAMKNGVGLKRGGYRYFTSPDEPYVSINEELVGFEEDTKILIRLLKSNTGWVGIPTLTQIKTYLTNNPITIIYQLATPIIVPLPNPISPNALQIVNLIEQVQGKANKIQEGWITPTLINGWIQHNASYPVGYYKDNLGIVHLRGLVSGGVLGTAVFILPLGYRATNHGAFIGATTSPTIFSRMAVDLGGQIIVNSISTYASLDAISFKV